MHSLPTLTFGWHTSNMVVCVGKTHAAIREAPLCVAGVELEVLLLLGADTAGWQRTKSSVSR